MKIRWIWTGKQCGEQRLERPRNISDGESIPLTRAEILHICWVTEPYGGFPCGSAGKESTCNVGDLVSIPGSGRSPGEGKGYPLQYAGLESCMDCIVQGVAKSRTWRSPLESSEAQEPFPRIVDFFCFFWPCYAAPRILVPQPGIDPLTHAVEAQSLNHWTIREVPRVVFKCIKSNTNKTNYIENYLSKYP